MAGRTEFTEQEVLSRSMRGTEPNTTIATSISGDSGGYTGTSYSMDEVLSLCFDRTNNRIKFG